MRPLVGVSWMTTPGFRAAVEPLLAEGAIEAVEWTVDAGFGRSIPPSAAAVRRAFGDAGRLYGHGVGYSPLSAGRDDVAERWLARLRADDGRYVRLSEHFGFSTGGDVRFGAPLPVPYRPAFVRVGQERLRRLADAARVPVGLENLALAWSRADALDQGPFVAELLDAVDGYLHLDLHNLWCQVANFDLEPDVLLARWPLDRVRVVHVSGGSWKDGVRRDTHDDRVPEPVWDLLAGVLPRIPGCEAVFVEQIGTAFADGAGFAADVRRARAVCDPGPGAASAS
jgi:uncharacterized protein (UPF0276 family)